jgi:enoyl-CoA hydratase/carnithine racemase
VSVKELINSLSHETRPDHAQWAADTLAIVKSRSPTMLEVALRQMRRGKSMSLADCLRMEIGMTWQCFRHGDFMEGVRAKLVDKDERPAWRPPGIDDVTEAAVEKIFENPWAGHAHPLDNLLGVP